MFDKLFSPITIRGLTLKGRVMWSACGTRFTDNHYSNDRLIAYHVARVKGGCPLNMSECTGVHDGSDANIALSLAKDEYVPEMKRLADAIHEAGGKFGVQLYQGGLGVCFDPDAEFLLPDTIDEEKMEEVRLAFGNAARRAVEAGADLIEVHCAHQYLMHSFISPCFNHRTDEYGGSFENRMRYPLACLKAVRDNMPDDMPLIIRTTIQDDYLDGLTVDDCIEFCKRAKEVGVDGIDLSRGNMSTSANKYEVPSIDTPRGFNLDFCEKFKKETGMVTIAVGRINDPYIAEKALEENKCDMVVMSRAQMADPEFVNKCREGRIEDINRCIGCNEGCYDCYANLSYPHISCTRNPQLGREAECPILPAKTPRKVLIAGGGPAGMYAAKILKAEGHTPILCEARDHLGGAFLMAGAIPRTLEMKRATEIQGEQLLRSGVEVRLNCKVDGKVIEEIKPDAVFCCIGAVPRTPDFASGKPNVVQARDVLEKKAFVSGTIVIVGGNGTGLQAAEYLANENPENKITVITHTNIIGADLGAIRKMGVGEAVAAAGIKTIVDTSVTDIKDGKVLTVDKNKETGEHPFDYVVLAVGADSRDCSEIEAACRKLGIGYEAIGDAREVHRAFEAYNDAFEAALRMNDPDYIKKIS